MSQGSRKHMKPPSFSSEGRKYLLCLFLGFFWTWMWIVLDSPTDLPVLLFDGLVVLPARVLCFFGFGLSCLVGILGQRCLRWFPGFHRGGSKRIVTFLMLTLLCGLSGLINFTNTPQIWLGWVAQVLDGVILGLVAGVLYVYCGTVICLQGSRFVLRSCAIASVIAAPIGFGAIFLEMDTRQLFVVLFPPLGYLCMDWLLGVHRPVKLQPAATATGKTPWKLIITILLFSLALGTMQSIFSRVSGEGSLTAVPIMGFILAAIGIALSVFAGNMDFNRLIYQIGFPLMSLGFILAALGSVTFVCYLLCACGFRFTEIVIWSLFAFLMGGRKDSPMRLFALFGLLMSVGQTAGLLAGEGLLSYWVMQAMPLLTLLALLFGALFLVTSKSPYEAWGVVEPGGNSSTDALDAACQLLAADRAFSTRETDVLLLAARGHNRDSIAQSLFLSKNTVKTHMKNLYQKLGVHSQQELIDTVEVLKTNLKED
jgi:DNA-binding CsgD family transcriptional regulator